MHTDYKIDDLQQTYFVIDSFEQLLADCYQDFGRIYDALDGVRDFAANEIVDGDKLISPRA